MRREDGFTLPTMMLVMIVVALFSVAALAAAEGDLPIGTDDQQRKQGYAAAEAGLQWYMHQLVRDNAYWTRCASPGGREAVNDRWDGAGADPRQWLNVPTSQAQFTVELLAANGYARCSTAAPEASMIDATANTFRVRATGRSAPGEEKRSIIATFRRRGFLDYIYVTDFETQDPAVYAVRTGGRATRENPPAGMTCDDTDRLAPGSCRSLESWANDRCRQYWYGGRGSQRFRGEGGRRAGIDDGGWRDFESACEQIHFYQGDRIEGPFHTNDDISVCGAPRFGRNPNDAIEVSAPAGGAGDGWRAQCGGARPQANFPGGGDPGLGTWRKNAPVLLLPPENAKLRTEALSTHRFKGATKLVLDGGEVRVTGTREDGTPLDDVPLPIPPERNGVIYVSNDDARGCGRTTNILDPPDSPAGCGNVEVRGDYRTSLTIAAANDVIVTDDVRSTGDAVLGLIANNFVRVWHPMTRYGCDADTAAAPGPGDVTIDAALLALQHSFTVDSYWCGPRIGTLTVNGSIAQRFRGPVGTFNQATGSTTGYTKNYRYDDRLRFRSPPHFLDPVQAAWKLVSQTEQVPAA